MERKRHFTLRLSAEVHRAYKLLVTEEGITMQEDLERYILRRLQEAGRLPKDEPPR